jgi:CelD/BcsL family acetyltransferase involved in cellulose biosynthesis
VRIETVALADAPAAAWDDLARAADNVFYERWMVEAALALRDAEPPRLLLAWDADDTLAGLLPLGARSRFGVDLATENWEQTIRALGQPLVRAGMERAFWQLALPWLDRTAGGAFLRLSALAADSPATLALLDLLAVDGRRHEVTRRYERAILRGGTTSADHAALHVRGKVLKEHRRLRARLGDRGAVTFDRLADDANPGPWIDALFALELTGWKGRDGVAAGADPSTECAFRTILVEAQARGRLDFHRLAVADQPIAMLACIEGPGDTAIQLKIAYDEEWASFSPGVLLEMEYLAHALDRRGLSLVDSCARAGHPMIDRIWPERREIISLAIPFDRWSSRLAVVAQATARRWRRKEAA